MEDFHAACITYGINRNAKLLLASGATERYASHVARRIIKPRYFHRIQNMQLSHLDYSTPVLPNTETYIRGLAGWDTAPQFSVPSFLERTRDIITDLAGTAVDVESDRCTSRMQSARVLGDLFQVYAMKLGILLIDSFNLYYSVSPRDRKDWLHPDVTITMNN